MVTIKISGKKKLFMEKLRIKILRRISINLSVLYYFILFYLFSYLWIATTKSLKVPESSWKFLKISESFLGSLYCPCLVLLDDNYFTWAIGNQLILFDIKRGFSRLCKSSLWLNLFSFRREVSALYWAYW